MERSLLLARLTIAGSGWLGAGAGAGSGADWGVGSGAGVAAATGSGVVVGVGSACGAESKMVSSGWMMTELWMPSFASNGFVGKTGVAGWAGLVFVNCGMVGGVGIVGACG